MWNDTGPLQARPGHWTGVPQQTWGAEGGGAIAECSRSGGRLLGGGGAIAECSRTGGRLLGGGQTHYHHQTDEEADEEALKIDFVQVQDFSRTFNLVKILCFFVKNIVCSS